jgi:hypothetical protein
MEVPLLFGPYGSGALAHVERLAQYGANAVWFHGFKPSAFDACARYGIAPCVEFATFRASFQEHPELIPIGADGKPIRYGRLVQGVCLSQHEFLDRIEEELLAGVLQYDPVGVWLDYLTYAGWFETPDPDLQESCFCSDCVAEFCQATGIDATEPSVILDRYRVEWARHNCERVAELASYYASLIRSRRPSCIVGAYMCPWRPEEYDSALSRIFAQDYRLLARAIDVYTPLIYAQKSGRSPAWGRQFLQHCSDFVPSDRVVQLILDVLDFPDSLLAVAVSTQPSWGVQIFGGAEIFGDPEKAAVVGSAVELIRQSCM